jgi:hypothetical protein
MGAKNGTSDSRVASGESGFEIMRDTKTIAKMTRKVIGNCNDWASCSFSKMEPVAA